MTTPAAINVGPAVLRASISAGPAPRPASPRKAASPSDSRSHSDASGILPNRRVHRPQIPAGEAAEQHAHRCAQAKLEAAERGRRETDEPAERR